MLSCRRWGQNELLFVCNVWLTIGSLHAPHPARDRIRTSRFRAPEFREAEEGIKGDDRLRYIQFGVPLRALWRRDIVPATLRAKAKNITET